jgi:hypothetical protein
MQFCKPSEAVEKSIGFATCSPRLFPHRHTTSQKRKEGWRNDLTLAKGCSSGMEVEGVSMTTTHLSKSDNTARFKLYHRINCIYYIFKPWFLQVKYCYVPETSEECCPVSPK